MLSHAGREILIKASPTATSLPESYLWRNKAFGVLACTAHEREHIHEFMLETPEQPNDALGSYTEGKVLRQRIFRAIIHQNPLFSVMERNSEN